MSVSSTWEYPFLGPFNAETRAHTSPAGSLMTGINDREDLFKKEREKISQEFTSLS